MTIFNTKPDVLCMAAVDRLDAAIGGGSWQWRVIVKTAPFWHTPRRSVYYIEAPSDTIAAQEGIRRFVEEDKQRASVLVAQSTTVH